MMDIHGPIPDKYPPVTRYNPTPRTSPTLRRSDHLSLDPGNRRRWGLKSIFLWFVIVGLFLFVVVLAMGTGYLTPHLSLGKFPWGWGGDNRNNPAMESMSEKDPSKCPFHRHHNGQGNQHPHPEPSDDPSIIPKPNTEIDLEPRQLHHPVPRSPTLLPPEILSILQEIETLPSPNTTITANNNAPPVAPALVWNKNQKIDLTGTHKFVPPKKGDLRGPCPGLNALANHGYLPHNGVVSLFNIVSVVNNIFGMGVDLGLILSVYATVIIGDPLSLSWSIGGPATTLLGFLLGQGKGLSGSHNLYEGDASLVSGDSYLHQGDADTFQPYRFKALLDLQKGVSNPNYCSLPLIIKHRQYTITHSISNNPHFFSGPLTGLLVTNAGHSFVPAFMCNYTAEYPAGILNEEMMMDWWAFDRDPVRPGEYVSRGKGWSTFPRNWHRRPIGLLYDYGLVAFSLDLVQIAAKVPGALKLGGNTGTVNSFTGIDLGNLTGGLYNTIDLLTSPSKIICFVLQFLSVALPGILRRDGLLGTLLGPALDLITDLITLPFVLDPSCPRLGLWDDDVLHQFPGAGVPP